MNLNTLNLHAAADQRILASPEAEQAVLGSLLMDPDALMNIGGLITPDDFYVERNRWIYQAILELSTKGMAADFVTVVDELERRNQLEELGGATYVMDLINVVPTAIHAEHYARIVEEHAVARRLLRAASQIVQLVYQAPTTDDACAGAIDILEDAARRPKERAELRYDELLALTRQRARDNASLRAQGKHPAIPYTIPELDRLTGGMWPGEVIIIAAPPGAGKTSLALTVAHHAAQAGYAGAVFSLEMTATQVGERTLATESNCTILQIRLGDIADWQAFDEAIARASTPNLFVDDSAGLTVAELVTRVKRLHLRHAIRFVVIDYVQLLTTGKWGENRAQELAQISHSLKFLAKELDIAVIAVAQLNREYSKRQNKKPVMSDLEGSSQWEKDAATVIFIHRESMYVPEADARKATLILAKARNGQVGEIEVGWHPRFAQFTADPLAMTEGERHSYRRQLARECGALEYGWDSWRVHRLPLDELVADARDQYRTLGSREKALVAALVKGLPAGQVDRPTLAELDMLALSTNGHTPPIVADVLNVGKRLVTLERARQEVVPALVGGRFALFTGPSGRGKTLLARIVQRALILEHGLPAVWLNWRQFMRDIKATFDGNGREAEVWQQAQASVLILDDPDKASSEFNVAYLYDVLDQCMGVSGRQRAVLMVLNHTPYEFGEQLAQHGYLGHAVAQRTLERSRPVWLDFGELPMWTDDEQPRF